MFSINLDQECGCFKRSDLSNNQEFSSKDDALMQASSMVEHMNSEFCGKHKFALSERGETFQITRLDASVVSGGCCGGGHCS
jgi:hypothetical protein